jgi:hypothetical protein
MSELTQQLARLVLSRIARKPPEEPLTVAQWLARAQAAHLAYRRAHDDRQHAPAAAALEEAAEARAQAELLDPDHLDPAWTDTGGTHPHGEATHDAFQEPLLRYYVTKLELVRPGDPPIPPPSPTATLTTH